jgi:hypothetical protein
LSRPDETAGQKQPTASLKRTAGRAEGPDTLPGPWDCATYETVPQMTYAWMKPTTAIEF